jgi:hypothetical protein
MIMPTFTEAPVHLVADRRPRLPGHRRRDPRASSLSLLTASFAEGRERAMAVAAAVTLATCNAGTAQKRTYTTSTSAAKNTAAGKCLDVTDGKTANGTKLQVWSCDTSIEQHWTIPA